MSTQPDQRKGGETLEEGEVGRKALRPGSAGAKPEARNCVGSAGSCAWEEPPWNPLQQRDPLGAVGGGARARAGPKTCTGLDFILQGWKPVRQN